MSRKETLEQFGSCWEGLEDPRSGNAGLHDFHELLLIALCCVLSGGQGAVDMALFAEARSGNPVPYSSFIGHGNFDRVMGDGILQFEDSRALSDPIRGNILGNILRDHDSLRLVVLNACEGARQSNEDPFSGVAQSLCQQQMPAVIAMQFEISDDAAKIFTEEFYAAIAESLPVDAAVSESRKALLTGRVGQEWATPVLYMRSPSGMLFDIVPTDFISGHSFRETGEAQSKAEAARLAEGGRRKAEAEETERKTAAELRRKAEVEQAEHQAEAETRRLPEAPDDQRRAAAEAQLKFEIEEAEWRVAVEAERKAEADRVAKELAAKVEADRVAKELAAKVGANRVAKELAAKVGADRVAKEKKKSPWDFASLFKLSCAEALVGYLAGLIYITLVTHTPLLIGNTTNYKPLGAATPSYFILVIVISLIVGRYAGRGIERIFDSAWLGSPSVSKWPFTTLGYATSFCTFFIGCHQFVFASSSSFLKPLVLPLWLYSLAEFAIFIYFQS